MKNRNRKTYVGGKNPSRPNAGLCGVQPFEPLSPRKAHPGGTVCHSLSIKGHDHVDRMGEAKTSPCFLSRGSSRLLH